MKKQRIAHKMFWALSITAVVVGGLYATRILAQDLRPVAPAPAQPPLAVTPPPILQGGTLSFADVAEKAVGSVVNISSTKVTQMNGQGMGPFFNDPFFREFFGRQFFRQMPRERRERSLGSGVIVSQDGVVLTNNHVIQDAEDIEVALSDGSSYKAQIVGSDPKSDLAVIRITSEKKNFVPIPFADSSALRLGDAVLAIGNPFGLSHTVTMGIVSAKGRANVGIVDYEDFIQTDAAINPGNSGGALVDLHGRLVGINTAIISRTGGYQGIGFAIPSNMAKGVMDSLLNYGKVVRGWLGVMIQEMDEDLASALDLKNTKGVLISDVVEDGPAAKGGLKRGDVVLRLDGEAVDSAGRLRNIVAAKASGATVKVDILRNNKESSLKVTLGEMPEERAELKAGQGYEGVLSGMTVEELNPSNRQKHQIPGNLKEGVLITGIEQGSRASATGLKPGDVLLEINRQPLKNVGQVDELLRKAKDKILLLLYREGGTLFLVLDNRR